jgi:hypothetical protein
MIMPESTEGLTVSFAGPLQGAKRFRGIECDISIGELIDQEVLPALALPRFDSQSRPIQWEARLERVGRFLHRSELVGESLQPDDVVTMQPSIDAG